MPDRSFSKEIFPNIQSEPLLTQLEAINTDTGVLHPKPLPARRKYNK